MAAPTTPVHVCNLAMARLGQASVSSIENPVTSIEDTCARHYDQARRKLLRRFIFNFARKLTILSKDLTVIPAFAFATAYKLPNDFIRLMALGNINILSGDLPAFLYEMSDGYLYCDSQQTSAGGLQMQYIFDAKDVTKFDPLFIDVLRLQLAADTAYSFSLSKTLTKSVQDELDGALLAASAVAGQEKTPRRIQRSRARDVRRSGGIWTDNTRI